MLLGPIGSSPVLQDYIEKETFGKAVALYVIGINVGMVVSLVGVLEIVKRLDAKIGWAISGGISGVFAVLTAIMVVEPQDVRKDEEEQTLGEAK